MPEGKAPGGALDELARDDTSRKRFLKMVGGAGAASAFAMVLAACGSDDEGGSGGGSPTTGDAGGGSTKGDIEIVNYALTLEYLEADFYDQVVASGQVTDRAITDLAKQIGEAEQAHVGALLATVEKLGGKPAQKPKTNFDSVLEGGPEKILATAAEVENVGAAAYLGQANRIKSKEVLAAALSIHSVEGRHAAALNTLIEEPATPDGAFAKPMAMDAVLAAVKPFIAS